MSVPMTIASSERADDDREFHLITPWIRQPGE